MSHHGHTKLCAFRFLILRPQILNPRSRNQIHGKLLLSWKLRSITNCNGVALLESPPSHGPNFMALLTAEFCAYDQAPNFCASLVSVECLVTWSTHAQKPKFAANPWNRLAVRTKFPASISADSVLTVLAEPWNWALVSFNRCSSQLSYASTAPLCDIVYVVQLRSLGNTSCLNIITEKKKEKNARDIAV